MSSQIDGAYVASFTMLLDFIRNQAMLIDACTDDISAGRHKCHTCWWIAEILYDDGIAGSGNETSGKEDAHLRPSDDAYVFHIGVQPTFYIHHIGDGLSKGEGSSRIAVSQSV